jgi:hypothetical protein
MVQCCQLADISAAKHKSGPIKIWAAGKIRGRKNPRPNYLLICLKLAEKWQNFLKVYSLHISLDNLIIWIDIFCFYFTAEFFVKQSLWKGKVCGRIFSSAAEFFGLYGRNLLPGVGNTGVVWCGVVGPAIFWRGQKPLWNRPFSANLPNLSISSTALLPPINGG